MEEKDPGSREESGVSRQRILEGLERLAFGSVTDPVRLLFCEEINPRTLNRLDLFHVSEIKRPRGGGMEIKFFDRLRALQCLHEMVESEGSDGTELYRILEQSARELRQEEDG